MTTENYRAPQSETPLDDEPASKDQPTAPMIKDDEEESPTDPTAPEAQNDDQDNEEVISPDGEPEPASKPVPPL